MEVLFIENDEYDVAMMRSMFNRETIAVIVVDKDGMPASPAFFIPMKAIEEFMGVLYAATKTKS